MVEYPLYPQTYRISKEVLDKIISYFDNFLYESGGAIGIKDGIISMFYPLDNECGTGKDFSPSIESLNKANDFFYDHSGEFIGIIHSHPIGKNGNGINTPSYPDIDFYKNFLKENKQFIHLVAPIITLITNEPRIAWYILENNELYSLEIEIV